MPEPNYEESVRFTGHYENGNNQYTPKRYDVSPMAQRRSQIHRWCDLDFPKPCILMLLLLLLISLLLLGLLPLLIPECSCVNSESAKQAMTTLMMDRTPSSPASPVSVNVSEYDYRLPTDLEPQVYTIKLMVFPDNGTTHGQINIRFDCISPTNKIILNTKNIFNLTLIELIDGETKQSQLVSDVDFNDEEEKTILTVSPAMILNKNYNLLMSYTGLINNFPKGIYRSSYIDTKTNNKTWVVNTLFSPTEARSAFPSFDEPIYKSRFNFIIGRPSTFMSISNMEIKNSEPIHDDYVLDHYFETPKMSTYLTFFLIGQFKHLENPSNQMNAPTISSYARSGGLESMSYAIEVAPKIVKFYEDYFGLKFPLSKIDIIAVPNQLYSAMENWGAITFKENKIFVPDNSTDGRRQSVALLLAHEIAHQWFGNLVTPKWWNDLWLKEGFSTYFGYIAIDNLMPEWNVFNRFSTKEMDAALSADSIINTEAISKTVYKPQKDLFSAIQYHKGASIIWMMSNLLGDLTTKLWVSKYLKEFSYKNADQEDLWDSITEQSHKTLSLPSDLSFKTIMDSWTVQPGYPFIFAFRENNSNKIEIYQQRFVPKYENNDDNSLWWIPISMSGIIQPDEKYFWFQENKTVVELPFLQPSEPYLMNLNRTGYYRVCYDNDNWIKLINYFSKLNDVTKSQLLVDSFAMAEYGYINYDIPLSMVAQLTRETNDLVWRSIKNPLYYIHNSLILTPAFGNYQVFVQALLRVVYYSVNPSNSTTWFDTKTILKDEDHVTNIFEIACKFELDSCVTNSVHLFNHFINNNINPIPISLRPIVYCTAIKHGGIDQWFFIHSLKTDPKSSIYLTNEESSVLTRSLGCSSKPWLLTKALGLILQPNSSLTKEEGVQLFKSVAENHIGVRIALSFLRSMSTKLIEYYKGPSIVYEMIESIIPFLNTPYDIKELKLIMANISKVTNENKIIQRQCLERAQNNINWMQMNFGFVAKFLEQFRKDYFL